MVLSSGLEIRIPNHQLVLPDYHISPQGELIVNGSDRVVRINSLQDVNLYDMPVLGVPFLSSAYLLVNQDTKQFTLWKSNPTTARNPLPIGENCKSVASFSRLSPSASTSQSALTSPFASTPPDSGPQNPKSTPQNRRIGNESLTGIIVSVIVGVFLFCGAMIIIRRRKKKFIPQGLQAENGPQGNESRQIQECNHGTLYSKPELPADRHPPQEMPLTQHPSYSLPPYELSGSEH